jgi:uncharacterized protein YecE (DUF72 family)
MANLYIGTCSWKYDSWRGLVYSENPKINYLKEYSEKFNSVEIDQWFWSLFPNNKVTLPDPKVVDAYNLSVPNDFKFTIKMPNSITLTHFYSKKKADQLIPNPNFFSQDLTEQTLVNIKSFGSKAGQLMFQFEYLNKQKMKSQFEFQILASEFIRKLPADYNYAFEIRNPNYLNKSYFEFLNENDLTHVFLEGYYMPSIVDTYKKFDEYINGAAVIRLHGPDRKGIEEKTGGNWSEIVEPKDEAINKIADMINNLLSKEVDVYLNINNHYEGCAPKTADKFRELLNQL